MNHVLKMKTKIILKKEITPGIFLMGLSAPRIANEAKPGQFIHIKCSLNNDPLLRRPISLHRIEKDKGNIFILFQIKGKGTMLLSHKEAGEYLDVLGPIGNGFTLLPKSKKVMVIGGGMGIAPLLTITEHCTSEAKKVKALIGASCNSMVLREKEFEKLGIEIRISTEDGSCQYKGFITDLFKEEIKKWFPDQVFACGPKEMLKIIAELTCKAGINCQVSLEERMACGIGACLGCVCKTKVNKPALLQENNGKENFKYKRVCIDGPVFDADEVIWDD